MEIGLETVFTRVPPLEQSLCRLMAEHEDDVRVLMRQGLREQQETEEGLTEGLEFSASQVELLALLDGRTPVYQLLEQIELDEQRVFLELIKLRELGLISIKGQAQYAAELRGENFRRQLRVLRSFGIALVLLLGFLLLADRAVKQGTTPYYTQPHLAVPVGAWLRVENARLERLQGAIEVYRLVTSHYPEKLMDLVGAGLIEHETLYFSGQTRFRYRRLTDGYVLTFPELRGSLRGGSA